MAGEGGLHGYGFTRLGLYLQHLQLSLSVPCYVDIPLIWAVRSQGHLWSGLWKRC